MRTGWEWRDVDYPVGRKIHALFVKHGFDALFAAYPQESGGWSLRYWTEDCREEIDAAWAEKLASLALHKLSGVQT